MSYPFKGQQWVFNSWPFLCCISQISHILSYYNWRQDFLLLKYHKNYRRCVHIFVYLFINMMGGYPFQLYLPPEGTPRLTMEHVCGKSAWSSLKSIPTPKTPAVKNNSELGCSQAEGIDNPFFLLKWALGLKLREQSMYWSFPTQFTLCPGLSSSIV